jgi:hypothetical protein
MYKKIILITNKSKTIYSIASNFPFDFRGQYFENHKCSYN